MDSDLSLGTRTATLGRTGLKVCRIGVGGGAALDGASLEYAIEQGVNLVFTSTDLHSMSYSQSWNAIRSARRDRGQRLIVVATSYVNDVEKLRAVLKDQLYALGRDCVDIFLWGWVTRNNNPTSLCQATRGAREALTANDRSIVTQVDDDLKSAGFARFTGVSTHDLTIAQELTLGNLVDVIMVRYNIAHRGADIQLFQQLGPTSERPGIIVFNASHDKKGSLTVAPPSLPVDKYVPDQADLYRYCLDHENIDVVLTGPRSAREIDVALSALDRHPLDAKKRRYLQQYGDLHSGRAMLSQ